MVEHLCSICQEQVRNTYVCGGCRKKWDLDEPWAKAAMRLELERRNMYRRDERFGFEAADRSGVLTFNEVLDGTPAENLLTESHMASITRPMWMFFYSDFWDWAESGGLTEAECNAVALVELDVPGEKAAAILSEDEGKPVTHDAYRRRVATARKKMRRGFPLF